MQVTVESKAPTERAADVLALPLAELDRERWRLPARAGAVDRALEGRLAAALRTGDFRGRRGESLLVYGEGRIPATRILLVGLGAEGRVDGEALREAAALAVKTAEARGARRLAVAGPALRRIRPASAAQALAEGAVLAGYRFDRYQRPREDAPGRLRSVALLYDRGADLRAARTAAASGVAVAESQNLARDLSNEPPNAMAPAALAREAQRVAKEVGLRVRVLEPAELRRRKMGAILAVGGGSAHPPRLIVLEHNAPPRRGRGRSGGRSRRTIALVGKGITFDSGGLSLKPTSGMLSMKHDMSGGATVIGALRAAALLRVPQHVVGIVGAAENLPDGSAYRPSDVVRTASGTTVEIGNTDAEGRLVLADALHYARTEYAPDALIDLATLTGACSVALGPWAAAVLGNRESLSEALVEAGDAVGERFWPLPLWEVHREFMRGTVADVKQVGGPAGGTITAAAFLSHFVGETPWAHLDIASTAETDQPTALQPKGATGFGVRSLVELLRGRGRLRLD